MHFSGVKFSSVYEKFSFTSHFLGSKILQSTFLKKKGFVCSFIELKCMWLQTGLAGLKKKQQTLDRISLSLNEALPTKMAKQNS